MITIDQLNRFVAPLTTRIRNVVARGVIKTVDDTKKVQQQQNSLLAGETKSGIERYQNYGFTSVPHPGMETVVVFAGGDRSNGIIVAVGDRQFRVKNLQPGEVAIYTDEGDVIKLGRNRKIQVTTLHLEVNATEDVTYNTKTMTINASQIVKFNTPMVEGSGHVKDAKSTMQAMRDTYNGHAHPGDSGGQTGTPTAQMS